MTHARKYIAWGAGILLWIFGLSILLSTIAFGYLDWPTVRHMALVLMPGLVLAAIFLFVLKRPEDLKAGEQKVAHVGRALRERTT